MIVYQQCYPFYWLLIVYIVISDLTCKHMYKHISKELPNKLWVNSHEIWRVTRIWTRQEELINFGSDPCIPTNGLTYYSKLQAMPERDDNVQQHISYNNNIQVGTKYKHLYRAVNNHRSMPVCQQLKAVFTAYLQLPVHYVNLITKYTNTSIYEYYRLKQPILQSLWAATEGFLGINTPTLN